MIVQPAGSAERGGILFTIAFVVHTGHDIMSLTIPQTVEALCASTTERYDLLLVADGVSDARDRDQISANAARWNIDEVRFRSRNRNCATGDPSNNGHFHTLSVRTPYLITIEEDVAVFRLDGGFDVLRELRLLFERHPSLAVATRVDDSDCWCWKLERVATDVEPGISSVNRVASHFLVYSTYRAMQGLTAHAYPEVFNDTPDAWFNYEDVVSQTFACPHGPGIAFLDRFPIRVFHCDRKSDHNSPFYTKEATVKISEFHARRREVERDNR